MSTLHARRAPAEVARERGWTVGTRIAGDEGDGLIVLEITALDVRALYARVVSFRGDPSAPMPAEPRMWCLNLADWNAVDPAPEATW